MRLGYIYKITNKINGKIYVGQTARDIETRFLEHCSEKKGHSRLHNAIQEYGWRNFTYEEIEQVPLNQIDEREKYWIKTLRSRERDIGYNIAPGGQSIMGKYNCVRVIENNIIFDSKQEMARIIAKLTSWNTQFLKDKISKALKNKNSDFLGYHLEIIKWTALSSDLNVQEDWIKTLNIKHQGKHIYCEELEQEFETIGEAAQYLIENNLYTTSSKTPIQSLTTSISKNINGKTQYIQGNEINYHFYVIPGKTTKVNSNFQKTKIYCQQLDKTFDSQSEAAEYLINNKIWTGIKLKTAKLRISDIIRGAFPDYKGYTFKTVE